MTVDTGAGVEVGDIIVFENPNGQGLKRVVEVNVTREGNVEWETEDASLAEVIEDGVLRSSLVISDMGAVEPTRTTRDGLAVYEDPAGAFQLTGAGPGVGNRGVREVAGNASGSGAGEVTFDYGVSLGYDVGFEPSIDTDARFAWFSLEYCRIVATGELSLDAWARFNLTGELTYNPQQKLYWGWTQRCASSPNRLK